MLHFGQARIHLALFTLFLFIFSPIGHAAENLGVLGTRPKWKVLEKYQETISHDDFARLIQDVYCTHGLPADMITMGEKSARILRNRDSQSFFTLRFAAVNKSRQPVPRLWRPAKALPRTVLRTPEGVWQTGSWQQRSLSPGGHKAALLTGLARLQLGK